ncbi:hypothetical protein [Sphingobium boeckii]|uniref:Uncharacterized protein n=1 Tax=Sphingobium boeckii TaxID=1082345 RepID=A0A7W9EEH2_9SPHN|nr:hypothetical protein [Sphingobium boeckii]MBB5686253.1 hypothetical protein [Sphingobium boeckii]
MPNIDLGKRDLFAMLGALGVAGIATAASGAEPAARPLTAELDFHGTGPIPWFKRIFHLYTGPDGLTIAEQLPTNEPKGQEISQLLRRKAFRVTLGGSAGGTGFDFHVAQHPTLLIPLFGTMNIGLHDGTVHTLMHGDLAFAEDCTGKGHVSRAGPEGSFMAAIQLPKEYCPASGSSDISKIWRDPA